MRRPSWRRPTPPAIEVRIDPAPAELARITKAIGESATGVFRGRATARNEAPHRDDAEAATQTSFAWQSDAGGLADIWCVLRADDARGLLEMVLDGPASPSLTSVERSIVRETIERLLGASGGVWEERTPSEVSRDRGWRADVVIESARVSRVRLVLRAPIAQDPPAPAPALVDLRRVPIAASAYLPPMGVRIDAVRAWTAGAVAPLAAGAEHSAQLLVGKCRLGAGRLGAAAGVRAIKIGEVARPGAT